MKANPLLIVAMGLAVIVSCKKSTPEKKIDTDILVSAETENSNVIIRAESEQPFLCMNYQINYELQKKGTTYFIKFTDIPEPVGCLTAPGPAIANILLGNLPPAEYPVTFRLNGQETKAVLKVDSTATIRIAVPGNVKTN